MMRKLLFAITICCTAYAGFGQLQRFPTNRASGSYNAIKSEHRSARTKQVQPLTLPFWDDFHKAYKDLYPDTSLWIKSFTVWVNAGMGINSPTLNVATFDGLDSAGLAYNPNQILLNGFTDSLVSQKIDLSETAPVNPVLIGERNSVYLSFFYQWQGNGEAPDATDYLQLEFKNKTNQWVKVLTIKPKETFNREVFYDTIVQVTGEAFFHPSFQFRFKSFGRQSGPYDTWNIDYVYLNKNRTANDLSFPDRAIASSISSLFKPYHAIPYQHFLADKKLDSVRFDVKNLKNFPSSTNYRAQAKFVNYKNGSASVYSKTLISSGGVKGGAGDMLAYERVRVKLSNLPDVNDPKEFDPAADSVDVTLKMKVISNDSTDVNRFAFSPVNLQVNDTISSTYHLKNYYAYDDGHAEYAAGLISAGNLSAYEFELQGVTQDTLVAFDIYFPPYGISSNQTVDFTIYREDPMSPGKPDEKKEKVWLSIQHVVARKGVDEFQRIEFLPALLIDERKFYIGWKQPVSGNVLVGLDISNDTGNKIFVNTNGFWYQNDEVRGSLMIRPVFGKGIVDVKVGIEDEMQFSVYPNPTRGRFYIEGKYDRIKILTVTGREVPFQSEEAGDNRTLITLNQPAGLYLIRSSTGSKTRMHKIIVSQ